MKLFHAHHHHKIRLGKLIHSSLWRFDFSVWLHAFARSMVAIFIPILLLTKGYDLKDVILYYLIFSIIDVPLNFLVREFIKRFNALTALFIGNASIIVFFVLLSFVSRFDWTMLIALAVLSAMYDTFYWVAHLFIFMEVSARHKDSGQDAGVLEIARQLGRLAGPAAGGVILIFGSDTWLLTIAAVLLFISVVPLINLKRVPTKPLKAEASHVVIMNDSLSRKDHIMHFLDSFHGVAEDFVFPVMIFVLFATFDSVAIVGVLVSLSAMFFSYIIGKHATKDRALFGLIGGVSLAVIWFFRIYVDHTLWFYVSVILSGLFIRFLTIPTDTSSFMRSRYLGPLQASVYRNAVSMIPGVIFFAILYFLTSIFTPSYAIALVAMLLSAALSVLYKPSIVNDTKK